MHVLWIIIKKKIEWDYRNIINDKFSHIFFSQVKSINGNDIILERCFILIKKKNTSIPISIKIFRLCNDCLIWNITLHLKNGLCLIIRLDVFWFLKIQQIEKNKSTFKKIIIMTF